MQVAAGTSLQPRKHKTELKSIRFQIRIKFLFTQMSSDSEAIDLMTLLIQAQYGFLVDVIRCHDGQLVEPFDLELFSYQIERLTR